MVTTWSIRGGLVIGLLGAALSLPTTVVLLVDTSQSLHRNIELVKVADGAWRRVEIRARVPGVTPFAPRGYFAPEP